MKFEMDSLYISIQCKASGIRQVPNVGGIITELKSRYVVKYRLDGRPQANGVVDTIVEIVVNHPFVSWVAGNIAWDMIKKGVVEYAWKPLILAMEKLEENESWDYTSVQLSFDDTTIKIAGYSKVFTTKVSSVISLLLKHYLKSKHEDFGFPELIYIPVINDDGKFMVDPGDFDLDAYSQFWGVQYSLNCERNVYDIQKGILLKEKWH